LTVNRSDGLLRILKTMNSARSNKRRKVDGPRSRFRRFSSWAGIVAGVALGVGVIVAAIHGPSNARQATAPLHNATIAASHYDLLSMSPNQFAGVDLALMNLRCATGLPGAEGLDIPTILQTLDDWAAKVRSETDRHLYRVTDPRYAEHYDYSEARLRAEFLVQVLQEDCGVRYNEERIHNVDFTNPADLFIHGMINNTNGGTCASMPVLYTAIGRRLGYPMKLVLAKQHIFCRWDDDKERFNIEGATNGGIEYYPDEHYRTWPRQISGLEMESGEFLKSLTPEEQLATFLLNRGVCLQANDRVPDARACLAEAHRLMPNSSTVMLALPTVVVDRPTRAAERRYDPRNNPHLPAEMRRELTPPADPRPGLPMGEMSTGYAVQR